MDLGRKIIYWVIPSIVVALVAGFFVIRAMFGLYIVTGPAMSPTLSDGDKIVIKKFIYRSDFLEPGDIVAFHYRRDRSRIFIERVIAVPEDTIAISEGKVFINGQLYTEPYILEPTHGSYPLTKVPAGHVFVMGDNRNISLDSRFAEISFIPYDLIIGKAVHIKKVK